jgi:hypothetical protein
MNRRKFFKQLGIGAATVAVTVKAAPLMKLISPVSVQATIGEYYDYCNFSSMQIAAALDKVVEKAAMELGKAAGQRIDFLYSQV